MRMTLGVWIGEGTPWQATPGSIQTAIPLRGTAFSSVRSWPVGTLLGGGALAAGLPRLASSAQSPAQAEIFELALLLERLQAAFYAEAAERAALDAELLEFAKVVAGHEREHAAYLEEALGSAAPQDPELDFGSATTQSPGRA